MAEPIRPLLLRLFDHAPRPSKWWDANDALDERGGEVAEMRVQLAELRTERNRLLVANVDLSAQLASVIAERDDLRRQADLAARQRNTAWVGGQW